MPASRKSASQANDVASVSSVDTFIQSLHDEPDRETTFTGMVRRGGDRNEIEFAYPGDCSRWLKIPRDSISSIKPLGYRLCDGHQHVFAQVNLYPPTDPGAKVYAGLADLHRTRLAAVHKITANVPSVANPCGCPPGHAVYDAFGNCYCI